MRTEDGHIVRRCLGGESSAFALLVDKYRSDVHALAFSRLGDFQVGFPGPGARYAT